LRNTINEKTAEIAQKDEGLREQVREKYESMRKFGVNF